MPEINWDFVGKTKSSNQDRQIKYLAPTKSRIFLGIKIYILFGIIHLLTNKTHAFISFGITATLLILKTKYNQSLLARIIDNIGWLLTGILNVVGGLLLIAGFIYATHKTQLFDLVLLIK